MDEQPMDGTKVLVTLAKKTKLDYIMKGYGLWLCLCMCTALGPNKMNSMPDH